MKIVDRRRWLVGGVVTALAAAGLGAIAATSAQAAAGCQVTYTVSSQWEGGFGANVDVTNLGDPVSNWKLTWSFGAGQTVTQLWNGSYTQSGSGVTVTNASYNGAIATNGAHERLRSGSSSFWALRDVEAGMARLADDLASGEWSRRYGALLEQKTYDAGYRLVVTED